MRFSILLWVFALQVLDLFAAPAEGDYQVRVEVALPEIVYYQLPVPCPISMDMQGEEIAPSLLAQQNQEIEVVYGDSVPPFIDDFGNEIEVQSILTPPENDVENWWVMSSEEEGELAKLQRCSNVFQSFDLFDTYLPLRWFLRNDEEIEIGSSPRLNWEAWYETPPGVFEYEVEKPSRDLYPNHPYKGLVSIHVGSVIPGLSIESGSLSISVASSKEKEMIDSASSTVHFGTLEDSVMDSLRASFSIPANEPLPAGPREWVSRDWDIDGIINTLPVEVRDNIILYAFLNKAAEAGSIEAAPVELLPQFPEYLAGMPEVFRYEIAVAQGNVSEAESLKVTVTTNHPGLIWRLKEIDEGQGLIAQAIALRQEHSMTRRKSVLLPGGLTCKSSL